MIFLLYVSVFVACSCVVLPLVVRGLRGADAQAKARPPAKDSRLSFLGTDGVR